MHPERAEANGKFQRGKNVFRPSTVCEVFVSVRGFSNPENEEDDDIRDM
jgi:hypothetical protein